ncbi:hypothetical protein MRX96_014899 [Rhipicephalus microplus]
MRLPRSAEDGNNSTCERTRGFQEQYGCGGEFPSFENTEMTGPPRTTPQKRVKSKRISFVRGRGGIVQRSALWHAERNYRFTSADKDGTSDPSGVAPVPVRRTRVCTTPSDGDEGSRNLLSYVVEEATAEGWASFAGKGKVTRGNTVSDCSLLSSLAGNEYKKSHKTHRKKCWRTSKQQQNAKKRGENAGGM